MATEKQLAANRANSLKSTGPRTQAGKDIARFNAVRHALTGQLTIVAPADHAAFTSLSARLTADLQPTGEQELQIAARIVRDTWRLHRASANEENIYALGLAENDKDLILTETGAAHDPALSVAVCNARTFMERSRDFERASLYEQRLKRGLTNDYKLYRQLQKDRISREKQALAKPRSAAAPSNGSVLANSNSTPFGLPVDRQIEPQIVNSVHPWVSPYPPLPASPVPDPYWPY
jgi:hypothetical protein